MKQIILILMLAVVGIYNNNLYAGDNKVPKPPITSTSLCGGCDIDSQLRNSLDTINDICILKDKIDTLNFANWSFDFCSFIPSEDNIRFSSPLLHEIKQNEDGEWIVIIQNPDLIDFDLSIDINCRRTVYPEGCNSGCMCFCNPLQVTKTENINNSILHFTNDIRTCNNRYNYEIENVSTYQNQKYSKKRISLNYNQFLNSNAYKYAFSNFSNKSLTVRYIPNVYKKINYSIEAGFETQKIYKETLAQIVDANNIISSRTIDVNYNNAFLMAIPTMEIRDCFNSFRIGIIANYSIDNFSNHLPLNTAESITLDENNKFGFGPHISLERRIFKTHFFVNARYEYMLKSGYSRNLHKYAIGLSYHFK